VREALQKIAAEPAGGSPSEFGGHVNSQITYGAKLCATLGSRSATESGRHSSVVDGKVVEQRGIPDNVAALRQLGVVPTHDDAKPCDAALKKLVASLALDAAEPEGFAELVQHIVVVSVVHTVAIGVECIEPAGQREHGGIIVSNRALQVVFPFRIPTIPPGKDAFILLEPPAQGSAEAMQARIQLTKRRRPEVNFANRPQDPSADVWQEHRDNRRTMHVDTRIVCDDQFTEVLEVKSNRAFQRYLLDAAFSRAKPTENTAGLCRRFEVAVYRPCLFVGASHGPAS
jgi:hypothetical protein